MMDTQKQVEFTTGKNSMLRDINISTQQINAANHKKAFDFMLKTLKDVQTWQQSAGISPVPAVNDAILVAEIAQS